MAGVEVGDALDGAGADGAEVRHLVDLHAAFLGRTIYALALVSPTLEHADALGGSVEQALLLVVGDLAVVGHLGVRRRGDRCALRHHVGPLAPEIDQRGQVGLPRFGVGGIHALIGVIIEVLVAEAAIAVAELMDQHLGKGRVVAGGDHHLVVDATATVGVAVDQHDDVLKGDTRQQVIEVVDVARGEVTVAVEGVVVGADGSAAPTAQVRHAGAALKRLGSDSHHVEAVLERLEGFAGKQGIDGALAVAVELAHLSTGVALGHDGQVDAAGDVGCLADGAITGHIVMGWGTL